MKLFNTLIVVTVMLFSSVTTAETGQSTDNKPNIVILATGGTIASTASETTDTSGYEVTNGIDTMLRAVPELADIAKVSGEQVANISSTDVNSALRLKLAKRINELLTHDDVDGIVVTHGTSTLEQTAYFLNLTVKSDKPVVVVGSMRPASALSADGPMNLYDAVKVAASDSAKGQGVLIVMNDRIGSARFTAKTSNWSTDTFKAFEQGSLGDIVAGKVRFYQKSLIAHTLNTEFDISDITELPKVDILYTSYADFEPKMIDAALESGTKGLVIIGWSAGSTMDKINDIANETPVVHSFFQATGQNVYDVAPLIGSNSLNPLKARILLQLALTKTTNRDTIEKMFSRY